MVSLPMRRRQIQPLSLLESAFTLSEIIVAFALFSILVAIAIPEWGVLLPTFRLNSAARQIQSELNRVKARAVSENTNFRLVFSAAGYSIERDNGTGYETTGESKPLPEGIDVRSTTTSTLGFTARGTATPGTGGTVKLCNIKEAGSRMLGITKLTKIVTFKQELVSGIPSERLKIPARPSASHPYDG